MTTSRSVSGRLREMVAALRQKTAAAVAARRRPVAAAGVLAAVVGSFAPWATYAFGYPGRMTVWPYPGGVRLYTLLLAVGGLLGLTRIPGRRQAAKVAAVGVVLIAGGTLVSMARDAGGLGAVAWGAWLTTAGGVAGWAAAISASGAGRAGVTASGAGRAGALPPHPAPATWPARATAVERLTLAATAGLVLAAVVIALDVQEATRFSAFLVLLICLVMILQAVGLVGWLGELFERHRAAGWAAAGAALVAFPFTQGGNPYWLRVFASAGIFAAAAIGLNVVVGLAGLLDLGYIAFLGVGAYVGGLLSDAALTTVHLHLPFVLVLLIGASLAAIFGILIGAPTLRLRGDYLAIVTLGFGEIFRIAAFNLDWLTRGPNGISGIPNLAVGGVHFGDTHVVLGVPLPGFANYYFVELLLLGALILAFTRLDDSRVGRAWVAIREDETAAAAMGIDTTRMKLLAFAIGAFMAGAAGALNGHLTTQVSPDSYTFLESILLLAAVVMGGMGTVVGALLGSTVLYVIPEKLRAFQDARLLLFGAALILMMRFRPEGMVPSRRRQREFHDAEERPGVTPGAVGAPPGAPVARA